MAEYGFDDCMMGGPGLDGYAYQADVYCVDCARDIAWEVFEHGARKVDWLTFCDSEEVPNPVFFGESDCAQHCGHCGEYLYGQEEEEEEEEEEEVT